MPDTLQKALRKQSHGRGFHSDSPIIERAIQFEERQVKLSRRSVERKLSNYIGWHAVRGGIWIASRQGEERNLVLEILNQSLERLSVGWWDRWSHFDLQIASARVGRRCEMSGWILVYPFLDEANVISRWDERSSWHFLKSARPFWTISSLSTLLRSGVHACTLPKSIVCWKSEKAASLYIFIWYENDDSYWELFDIPHPLLLGKCSRYARQRGGCCFTFQPNLSILFETAAKTMFPCPDCLMS